MLYIVTYRNQLCYNESDDDIREQEPGYCTSEPLSDDNHKSRTGQFTNFIDVVVTCVCFYCITNNHSEYWYILVYSMLTMTLN